MNILISAPYEDPWISVAEELYSKGVRPVYWVGGKMQSQYNLGIDCFFHEFGDNIDKLAVYFNQNQSSFFDFEKEVTLEEYFNYIKILDRHDNIGGYSFSQRNQLLISYLNYWFNVLKELSCEFVVFSNIPHLIYDYPLYLVCKKIGINMCFFNRMPFKQWYFVSSIPGIPECLPSAKYNVVSEFKTVAVDSYYKSSHYEEPWYMKKQKAQESYSLPYQAIKFLTKKASKYIQNKQSEKKVSFSLGRSYLNQFHKRVRGYQNFFHLIRLHMLLRRFYKEYKRLSIDNEKLKSLYKYIYVPLHYQPEATTLPLGGFFSDQLYMIKKLRSILPDDITILVKEHRSQFNHQLRGYKGRYLEFWDEIMKLHNVLLCPLDADPKKLILDSLLVATVTGTAGWEAIVYKKPCVIFGNAWYKNCPGVISCDDPHFEEKLLKALDKNGQPTYDIDGFISKVAGNLINSDFFSQREDRADHQMICDRILSFLNGEVDSKREECGNV